MFFTQQETNMLSRKPQLIRNDKNKPCSIFAEFIQPSSFESKGCLECVWMYNIISICPGSSAQTNLSVALTHLFEVVLTCGHLCLHSLHIET